MASNYTVPGSVGRLMREEMASMSRHMVEKDTDPLTSEIAVRSDRVMTVLGRPAAGTETNAGSPFEATHPVSFGRSGAIRYQGITRLLGQDNPPHLSKVASYPSAANVPQRSTKWLTIGLKWLVGSLTVDLHQWMALKSGNPVEDFLANWLQDPMKILMQQLTGDFLGSQYGTVGRLAAALTNNTGGAGVIQKGTTATATLDRNVRGLWRGQRLQAWANNAGVPGAGRGGTGAANLVLEVTKIPSFGSTANQVQLLNTTPVGSGVDVAAFTTLDFLTLEGAWDGTTQFAINGMGNFVDNTVTIHGLDRTLASGQPELQAYNDTNAGVLRNPEPMIFQKAYDKIFDRGFKQPDVCATTRGVRSLYAKLEGLFKAYNTGLNNPVQRGADGGMTGTQQFTTEDGIIPFIISAFVKKSDAWLIRKDALVKYIPGGNQAISFLGEWDLLGGNMFMPATASDEKTTVAEAPFNFWYENGCLEPQCLGYISDLNELSDVT